MARMPEIEVSTRHRIFIVSRKCYGVAGKIIIAGRCRSLFLILQLFRTRYVLEISA